MAINIFQYTFHELQNPRKDAPREIKYLQELINNNKWEDGEKKPRLKINKKSHWYKNYVLKCT